MGFNSGFKGLNCIFFQAPRLKLHIRISKCMIHATCLTNLITFIKFYEQYKLWSSSLRNGARCWWRSWLRHCAKIRKVAGSVSGDVIGRSYWHNPSGSTLALGSTQPLGHRAYNLTTIMCRMSWNLRASTPWNPQGLSRPVNGIVLPLHLLS